MNRVVMKRGWKDSREDPTLSDVLSLMEIVEAEEGRDGPPDIVLEFFNQDDADNVAGELAHMLAFDVKKPPLWLVQFSIPRGKECYYLATSAPISNVFVVRTSCGVIERYRQECLLERSGLLREAIEWFLERGSASPSLTWLEYDNVVRDVNQIS
ncbi:MAG: hypothetical protein L0Y72_32130 [Gemmataceae bacterium]|nr:hypothetical protein [Gemmataceae bacterium]MCI0743704.1 hypothetical protein [Gemmataceae bacterium]